jgi:hypothetical protein
MFDPSVYEARYGFTLKSVLVVIGAAAGSAAVILLDFSLFMRIITLALFGVGGLFYLANLLARKVALRVDRDGITVGGTLIKYRARTKFIPWDEVESVVLFTQIIPTQHGNMKMPYVGVQRKPGLTSPPSRLERAATILTPGVPADIVMTSTAVNGWRLDERALSDALPPHIRLTKKS